MLTIHFHEKHAGAPFQGHDCSPDTVSAPCFKNPPAAAAPTISIVSAMKRCDHTRWLSICGRSGRSALVQSDRPATIADDLPSPDTQQPSLFVLIGNAEKSIVLQALFGTKKARRCVVKPRHSEIHLHLDPATTFTDRPVLLASCDMQQRPARRISAKRHRCHRETRHVFRQQVPAGGGTIVELLPHLLFPHADVFCFFSDDLGGFRPIARRLALWLDQNDRSSAPPKTALPSVLIVTSKLSPGAEAEERAKRAFLYMLEEETTVSPYRQLSAIDVVAVLPKRAVSAVARCGRIKDRLMEKSDRARREREARRTLYSATHMAAFLQAAATHFARSLDTPFDFIHASRVHNHVAPDLTEHLSNFLKHTVSSTQLTEFAAPMIASALLLDSYPPNAHRTSANSSLALHLFHLPPLSPPTSFTSHLFRFRMLAPLFHLFPSPLHLHGRSPAD